MGEGKAKKDEGECDETPSQHGVRTAHVPVEPREYKELDEDGDAACSKIVRRVRTGHARAHSHAHALAHHSRQADVQCLCAAICRLVSLCTTLLLRELLHSPSLLKEMPPSSMLVSVDTIFVSRQEGFRNVQDAGADLQQKRGSTEM